MSSSRQLGVIGKHPRTGSVDPPAKGQPHRGGGEQVGDYLRTIEEKYARDPIVFQDKQKQAQFGATYFRRDPDDERMQGKIEMTRTLNKAIGGNVASGVVTTFLEDSDYMNMRRKQDAGLQADIEDWFIKSIDTQDPNTLRYARDIMPEYFDRREQELMKNLEVARTLGKINIRGVQSKEDLMFQFAVQAGKIAPPAPAFWEPGRQSKEQVDAAYQRGMFNPYRSPSHVGESKLGVGSVVRRRPNDNLLRGSAAFGTTWGGEDPSKYVELGPMVDRNSRQMRGSGDFNRYQRGYGAGYAPIEGPGGMF